MFRVRRRCPLTRPVEIFRPLPSLLLSVNREVTNKDMQLSEVQEQLEAESCFSVSML